MTLRLRFFDDYGSGWLWPGDAAAHERFGFGPIDPAQLDGLTPETLALWHHLLDRSAASLNHDDPPAGCVWPLKEKLAFDAAATDLLRRLGGELGARYEISDERQRLHP